MNVKMMKRYIKFCYITIVALSILMVGCKSGSNDENFRKGEPLALFTEGEVNGFVDTKGNVVIDLSDYTDAKPFSEGLAAVQGSDGKWGFIDTKGKLVIPFTFEHSDYSSPDATREPLMFHKGYARVRNVGLIDRKGNVVFSTPLTIDDWNSDVVNAYGSGSHFLFDTKGQPLSDQEYDELIICANGMILCQTSDGYGYLDKTGAVVIAPQYRAAFCFEDGLATVVDKDGKSLLIDEKGNVKKELDFRPSFHGADQGLHRFHDGLAVVSDPQSGMAYIYINSQYEPQFGKKFSEAGDFCDGYAAVQDYDSEEWGFIDSKGNYVVEPQFSARNAVACEGGYGIVYSSPCLLVNLKNGSVNQIPDASDVVAKRMIVSLPGEHSYSRARKAILSVDGEEIMAPTNSKALGFFYSESDNSISMFH